MSRRRADAAAAARASPFPGFTDQTSAKYTANEAQVFGEVAYGVRSGALSSERLLDLAFIHVDTGGFAETGGIAFLDAGQIERHRPFDAGTRIAGLMILPNGAMIVSKELERDFRQKTGIHISHSALAPVPALSLARCRP